MEQKDVKMFESVWLQEHRETQVQAVKQEQVSELFLEGGVKSEPRSVPSVGLTTEFYFEENVRSKPGHSVVKTEPVSEEDVSQIWIQEDSYKTLRRNSQIWKQERGVQYANYLSLKRKMKGQLTVSSLMRRQKMFFKKVNTIQIPKNLLSKIQKK